MDVAMSNALALCMKPRVAPFDFGPRRSVSQGCDWSSRRVGGGLGHFANGEPRLAKWSAFAKLLLGQWFGLRIDPSLPTCRVRAGCCPRLPSSDNASTPPCNNRGENADSKIHRHTPS